MIATEQWSQYSHIVLREIAFLALEIDRDRDCLERQGEMSLDASLRKAM